MAEAKNLGGKYRLKTWMMSGDSRTPPGTVVDLGHEDAERMLAQGCVESIDAAPAPKPEAVEAKAQSASRGGSKPAASDGGAAK